MQYRCESGRQINSLPEIAGDAVIRVGRFVGLCVVLAPLPNITTVLSSTLPLKSCYCSSRVMKYASCSLRNKSYFAKSSCPFLSSARDRLW